MVADSAGEEGEADLAVAEGEVFKAAGIEEEEASKAVEGVVRREVAATSQVTRHPSVVAAADREVEARVLLGLQ